MHQQLEIPSPDMLRSKIVVQWNHCASLVAHLLQQNALTSSPSGT